MAKLEVIWRTLTVASNPLAALTLKNGKKPKKIKFKNSGTSFCLTWPQFRVFRDQHSYLTKYKVTQIGDDLFRVSDERSELTAKSEVLPMMFDLMRDYALHQEGELYHLKTDGMELVGSYAMLDCFQEVRKGDYQCDCKGKVVLDVGGFEGESAVYFYYQGAKKVVIYEPVVEHIDLIKRNLALNGVEAELHQAGVGEKDGTVTVEYSKTDPGFGISHTGPNNLTIAVADISKAIARSGADIGKFDCEGAEQYLTGVPKEILREIGYYIVETHSPEIRSAVIEKFSGAGFKLEKERPKSWRYSVLSFKRTD